MKKITFLFLAILIMLFLVSNKGYQFKIELITLNLSPSEIDKNISQNIEKELLKIKEIKELVLLSSEFGCNVYIKLYPFVFNKTKVLLRIKNKIDFFKENNKLVKETNYIDDYDLNYQYFLVITSDYNYYKLKEYADDIENEILNSKIANNIKKYGIQQKVNYIYFNSNFLVKYNIELEEIKNIIQENNQIKKFVVKNEKENYYPINIKSYINSIEDIKKIPFNFKDKNFIITFDNVFDIKDELKFPSKNKVMYNNKDAIVFLISKKYFHPLLFLRFLLKEKKGYEVNIFKINNYKKMDLYFNDNFQFQNISNLDKDNLYFFSKSPQNKNNFDETIKNCITIYTKNPNKVLEKFKNNNFSLPAQNLQINYLIDGVKLKENDISQREVLNTVLSQNEGLVCDCYYENNDKIEIILKNKETDNFIYSKKYKTLVDLSLFIETELKNQYILILRKNGKICPMQFKNPSL